LSQAYFFKDSEALDVLECLLSLEPDIEIISKVRQVGSTQLENELMRIAIKCVRDAHDVSEEEQDKQYITLLGCSFRNRQNTASKSSRRISSSARLARPSTTSSSMNPFGLACSPRNGARTET
jgi:hypothetical protein